jgi:hypothetical protein
MTADIFRRHGVFFGDVHTRGEGRMGYNEHPWLKKMARQVRPNCYLDIIRGTDPELKIGNWPTRWVNQLKEEGWDLETPWGAKVDVFCRDVFRPLNPYYVGLLRDPDDILGSCQRAMPGRFTEVEWERIIKAHHDRIAELGIPTIDTDRVVNGDYSAIEETLSHLGLGLSEQIVNSVIDGRS